MEKTERLYYSIGEVAKDLDLTLATLRFWESEFSQVKPFKNKRGVRYYKKEDIEIIKQIHYLTKTCGFTLEGAKAQMKTNSQSEIEIVRTLEDIKGFLLELKETL